MRSLWEREDSVYLNLLCVLQGISQVPSLSLHLFPFCLSTYYISLCMYLHLSIPLCLSLWSSIDIYLQVCMSICVYLFSPSLDNIAEIKKKVRKQISAVFQKTNDFLRSSVKKDILWALCLTALLHFLTILLSFGFGFYLAVAIHVSEVVRAIACSLVPFNVF